MAQAMRGTGVSNLYLPPVLPRFGPAKQFHYPDFPVKPLRQVSNFTERTPIGIKRCKVKFKTYPPTRRTRRCRWVNVNETDGRVLELMKASEEGRKRISVLPPLQMRSNVHAKNRRRIAKAVHSSLEAAHHSHWHKPSRHLSLTVDRKVIAHLRRKLIRRLEQRLYNLDEVEDDLDAESTRTPRTSAIGKATATPKDIFSKYSEVGEKLLIGEVSSVPLRLQPIDATASKVSLAGTEQSESSSGISPSPGEEVKSFKSITPLPNIENKTTMPEANVASQGQDNPKLQHLKETESAVSISGTSLGQATNESVTTESDFEQRFDKDDNENIPPEFNDEVNTALEREVSLFTLTKVVVEEEPEPDVSPVATPVMFRPMTREETRLSFNDRMDRVIQGQVHRQCPPDDRALKLYVSSGFADTEVERILLMEKVFPLVKEAVLGKGYELEVYDLHWALKDTVSDDHRIQQLCMDMVIKSRESPFGTCFLLFLGEKYGPYILPSSIPEDEFDKIYQAAVGERERQDEQMATRAAVIEAARVEAQKRRQEMEDNSLDVPGSNRDSLTPSSLSSTSGERISSSRLKMHAEMIRKEAQVVRFLREDQSKLPEKIDDMLDVSVLNTWYKRDTNVVPSVYRLQNISSQVKDFSRGDASKRQQAKTNWLSVSKRLTEILQTMALKVIEDPAARRKYFVSLLDMEIEHGIVQTDDPNDRCFVVQRTLEHLQKNLAEGKVADYLDITIKGKKVEVDEGLAERIDEIRECVVPENMDPELIKEFRVIWNNSGILTSGNRGHHVYLEKLTQTLTDHLLTTLTTHTGDTESLQDKARRALYDEISHHVRFCHQSAIKFHGRKEMLMKVKAYLRCPANVPLVVYGGAGTGKTALLSKASKEIHKWFKGSDISVLYRLIGISENATNIRMLLYNLCQQLCEILDEDSDIPTDTKGIVNEFSRLLSEVPGDKHVIIVLDSLDRLSDENDGRKLQWMPRELPANVHIVVSTLPDEKYGCLKALKGLYPHSNHYYLELHQMTEEDAIDIIDKWFMESERTLTDHQYEVLLEAFKNCPTPLFLDTAFHEALSWTSFMDTEHVKLGDTVKKIATIKYGRLERDFGEPLVRRALGYLTASRDGVSSNEMEDLLSLDEVVMEDVKSQLTPSKRRIPSVLWIGLREELMKYLMLCRAGGICTLRWKHVQFHEAAKERYLLARDKAPSYHKAMAEYFLGKWSDTPKPYPGNEAGCLRYVAHQSLYTEVYDSGEVPRKVYNARRMRELPHHLLNSNQTDLLKSEALCNFEYILAKICATSLRALLEEYHIALTAEPTDADLKLLADTLQLSQRALAKEPRQVGAQIAGRLNGVVAKDVPATAADPCKYPYLKDLLAQIPKSSVPTLIPSVACLTEPGGVLFDLLCGHNEAITAATLTTDGMRALTTAKDDTMKLWDLRSGRVVRTIDGVGRDVSYVKTALGNSLAITSEVTCIRVWSLRTGAHVHTFSGFDDPAVITTAGEGRLLVAVFDGINTLRVWDMENNFQLRHETDVQHAGVHQDNSAIVAGNPFGDQILFGARGTKIAYLQNARTGRQIHTVKCHEETSLISCLAITRDYLVLGCKQPYMKLHEIFVLELFDIKKGHFLRNVRGCTHDSVQELLINQIGSHAIAVCSSEQNNMSNIALWNLETEDHKHLARHANVSKICVCLDFRYCLTAAVNDKTLRIWNLSGKVNLPAPKMKKFNGICEIVPMVDNARYVVAKAMNNGPLSVWNIAKAKCLQGAVRIERGLVDQSDVLLVRNTKIVILTDRGFSSVSDDSKPVFQTVLIYNLKTKKYDRKLSGVFITPSPPHEYVLLEDDVLMGLSNDRNHFVSWSLHTGHVVNRIRTNFKEFERQRMERGEPPKEIQIIKRATTAKMLAWDRRSETDAARQRRREVELDEERKRIEEIKKEKDNSIDQYIISGDNKVIVASFFAHHLCVFDMLTHSHKSTLENESSMMFLYTAALTHDGSYLAQANYDENSKTSYVTLWNCNTGQVKRRLKNESDVCAIAVTHDGERVVFGKSNNEMRIWDPMRQNSVRRIKGYAGFNFHVGSKIFLVENDTRALVFAGDISLWDIEEASVLATFTPDMKIQCCSVAMDGKVVAFGLLESTDVIVLKLASKDIQPIQDNQGEDIFGETTGDTSDEDEDEDEG